MASRCFFPRDASAAADGRHQQSKAAAEALEQLRHGGRLLSREDVGGAVRVRIVVSRRELKQMVAALGDDDGAGAAAAAASSERRHRQRGAGAGAGAGPGAEQRLQSLRRRSARRAAEAARRTMQAGGEWEPGLQSIPEENLKSSPLSISDSTIRPVRPPSITA
uniref:Uncharacterized protein n=1 Tax=Zea mays TaxID=4577 RepID=A0A804NUC5_MAIZE